MPRLHRRSPRFAATICRFRGSLSGHHKLNAYNCLPAILNVLHPLRLGRYRWINCSFGKSISYVLTESSPTWLEMSGHRINQDLAEEWRDIETQLESLSS